MMGDEYNFKTYNELKMPPVFYIKNTGHNFVDNKISFENKDSKNFVFFGSSPSILKGLDLLLEVFSELGEPYHLYVCGGFKNEEDFCKVYDKELFHTQNIHPIGQTEIDSDLFWNIMNKCAYSILPSCSEGQSGSVLTTMSAGVINIVSRICGFIKDDNIIILPDEEIKTIKQCIVEYGNKDNEWINEHCEMSMQWVKKHYSEEMFRQSARQALNSVIK